MAKGEFVTGDGIYDETIARPVSPEEVDHLLDPSFPIRALGKLIPQQITPEAIDAVTV